MILHLCSGQKNYWLTQNWLYRRFNKKFFTLLIMLFPTYFYIATLPIPPSVIRGK